MYRRQKMSKIRSLFVIAIVLMLIVDCEKTQTGPLTEAIAAGNSVYKSSEYDTMVKLLSEFFEGYENVLPREEKECFFIPKTSVHPIEDICVEYRDDGLLKEISGYDKNKNYIKCEFKYQKTKDFIKVEEIFYEGDVEILFFVLIFDMNQQKLHSLIEYVPNESYNIVMDIEQRKIGSTFRNSEFAVNITIGNQKEVFGVVSPGEFDKSDFINELKKAKMEIGLPPVPVVFLEPNFLKEQILLTIKELEEYGSNKAINWQVALDIFGTGLSDTFGPWTTGIYGALSYLACAMDDPNP